MARHAQHTRREARTGEVGGTDRHGRSLERVVFSSVHERVDALAAAPVSFSFLTVKPWFLLNHRPEKTVLNSHKIFTAPRKKTGPRTMSCPFDGECEVRQNSLGQLQGGGTG